MKKKLLFSILILSFVILGIGAYLFISTLSNFIKLYGIINAPTSFLVLYAIFIIASVSIIISAIFILRNLYKTDATLKNEKKQKRLKQNELRKQQQIADLEKQLEELKKDNLND